MPHRPQFSTDDYVKICRAPDPLLQNKVSFASLESQQSSMWLFSVKYLQDRDQESQAKDPRGPHGGCEQLFGLPGRV